ncbi:MAG: GNAT family N-acetyltransferase [bacterium]|nr:GNAT family N-acetyltransferase [bacterium]
MEIITYQDAYRQQIIDLILHIQNDEAKIGLSLEEQPDLLDIPNFYEKDGGQFWLATEDGRLIGTLALMNKGNGNGVLKKGFVDAACRKRGVLTALYRTLLTYAKEHRMKQLLFDTPSVAVNCHRFFEKEGYVRITRDELPFAYEYPDRDSYLYLLRF